MNLRQLKYFIAVAEELNFGRAAARLHISQPPVTRQIQQLEADLDAQLFLRTPRGVELTSAGALFLDEARNIVALLNQATDRVKRASAGTLGRLDVAIFGSAIMGLIPRIILDFKRQCPDVTVALHNLNKLQQVEALNNRTIDVGFNRMMAPVPGLTIQEIARETLFVAVSQHAPLAQRDHLDFAELAHHPLILFPASRARGFVEKVTGMCHEAGFAPDVAQVVGDAFSAMALVASGFGLCLVPESVIEVKMPGVTFLPLTSLPRDATVDLSCIYRQDDPAPSLRNFLRVAQDLGARQSGA